MSSVYVVVPYRLLDLNLSLLLLFHFGYITSGIVVHLYFSWSQRKGGGESCVNLFYCKYSKVATIVLSLRKLSNLPWEAGIILAKVVFEMGSRSNIDLLYVFYYFGHSGKNSIRVTHTQLQSRTNIPIALQLHQLTAEADNANLVFFFHCFAVYLL
jgi:hypothetical protein